MDDARFERKPPIEGQDESSYSNKKQDSKLLHCIFVPYKHRVTPCKYFDFVFKSKKDCLNELRRYPEARFKSFQRYADAIQFIIYGPVVAQMESNNGKEGLILRKLNCKRPTLAACNHFCTVIMRGDLDQFNKLVSQNPGYLVNQLGTPTILRNVFRYNALHICCIFDKAEICSQLLQRISSTDFFKHIYPDDSEACARTRANHLLDCYLNTPDETSRNLTPLHCSLTVGSVKCVRVLMSYPNCSRNSVERHKRSIELLDTCKLPFDDMRNKMKMLLGDHYYVPIFHDEDKLLISIIAEPMSPSLSLPEPGQQVQPSVGYTTIPSYKLHGYAGPMSYEQAKNFHSEWSKSLIGYPKISSKKQMNNKDLNAIGRRMAINIKVPFKEYWNFLGKFVDITMGEGMQKFEARLQKMKIEVIAEREVMADDPDLLGSNTSSRAVVTDQNVNNASTPYTIRFLCIHSLSPYKREQLTLEVYPRSLLIYVLKCQRERRSQDLSLSLHANISDYESGLALASKKLIFRFKVISAVVKMIHSPLKTTSSEQPHFRRHVFRAFLRTYILSVKSSTSIVPRLKKSEATHVLSWKYFGA